jgi:hypothetical protein
LNNHRVLDGVDDLFSAADKTDDVGLTLESFVESPVNQVGVARVIRTNRVRHSILP